MKQTLLISTLLFSASLFAQQLNSVEDTKQTPNNSERPGVISGDRATPFWEEDFAGGIPAGWAIIDSSGICPWRHSYDGSYGFFSTSGVSSGDAPIASTTGSNGFLICDNDSANNVNYGQPSGTTYQYLASYFGIPAIDCSSHSSVILRFEQAYRYNNSVAMFVQVSTDSVNWTSFNVSGGVANNSASPNPDVEVVNISSIASNQPEVFLRFGWSARVYYWMIDDISLSEADPNDVVMGEGYWGTGTFQYQYYKIPMTQNPVVTFYGPLNNNTGVAMTNAYFDVDVTLGTSVFSGTSNFLSLAATQIDTTFVSAFWTPTAAADYDINFDAAISGFTDGNLANNNFADHLEITSSLYGVDNLPLDGTGYQGGISNWSGNTGMPFGIGNVYEVVVPDEIECVQIGITTAAANEGNLIYGAIYAWDGAQWVYLGQTQDYTITNSDLGNVVSLMFDSGIAVSAGQEIVVLACHYGGTDVQFMMAQSVPQGNVIGFDAAQSWYSLLSPKAIVCRANFACGLGVDEQETTFNFSVYPNPANDIINLSFELIQANDVSFQLLDVQGKIVYSSIVSYQHAGMVNAQIPVNEFANGVYTLRLKIGDNYQYRKITIQ